MKKILHFLILGLVAISINSCSEDNISNSTDSTLQASEGRILVVATDNIIDDQFVHAGYEVFLEDTATQDVTYLDVEESEMHKFISMSGDYVEIDRRNEGRPLKSRFVTIKEENQLKGRGGKGNNGDKGGGGGAKILLVMVSDATSTPNCSAEAMEYQLIGADNAESAANLFTASSKGKFTIGSVTSVEVYINSITCSVTSLSRTVNNALSSLGVSTRGYNHIMYVTAPICGYGGQATLNGNIVHNAYCSWPVVSPHELGHNIGMHHSTAYNSDGSVSPYGDPSCIMATSWVELNAPHRIEMGWLGKKSTLDVKTSGTYLLSPLELNNTPEKQVLVLDIGMINFNRPEKYYLSYRAPIGAFDNNISVSNKLSIHTWSGENSWVTRYVDAIAVGEVFTDAVNGVEFTNLGIQNEVMTVSITYF